VQNLVERFFAPTNAPSCSFFPPEQCEPCPQRPGCVSAKHTSRTIEVGPNEALLIDARAYQRTDAYKADRRARQIVERQVARMVRLGARLARFFGSAKVGAQIAFIAAVVNLTRLASFTHAVAT
jgi:Transposase DDE domain